MTSDLIDRVLSKTEEQKSVNAPTIEYRSPSKPLEFVPFDRIAPILNSNYLIEGWLDRHGASVIYGDSNVGKTFLALDMAIHVAAGSCWHGQRVLSENSGGVLYIAGEGGSSLQNRICATMLHYPKLADKIRNRTDGFRLLPDAINFHEGAGVTQLINELKKSEKFPSLIVIDTLARAMGKGDENTAKDMGLFITNVDRVRKATGCHILIIHHSGKDSRRGARGSGSLRAAVDTEICLTRVKDTVIATQSKQRDGKTGTQFAFKIKSIVLGKNDFDKVVEAGVIEPAEVPESQPKLGPQVRTALSILKSLTVAAKGESGGQKTKGTQPIGLKEWKDKCYAAPLSNKSPDACKMAFSRAKNELVKKDLIEFDKKHVWLVQSRNNKRNIA